MQRGPHIVVRVLAGVVVVFGLGAALGTASRAAHASDRAAPLDADITWSSCGVPHVTARGSRLADDALRATLARGLRTRLEVRVSAFDGAPGSAAARASLVRTCVVVLDAWERRYVVHGEDQDVRTESVDDALATCLDVEDVAIGEPAAWRAPRASSVTFALDVALNPIAASVVGWLARSEGGTGEPTFFGAWLGRLAFARGGAERTVGTRVLRADPGGDGT